MATTRGPLATKSPNTQGTAKTTDSSKGKATGRAASKTSAKSISNKTANSKKEAPNDETVNTTLEKYNDRAEDLDKNLGDVQSTKKTKSEVKEEEREKVSDRKEAKSSKGKRKSDAAEDEQSKPKRTRKSKDAVGPDSDAKKDTEKPASKKASEKKDSAPKDTKKTALKKDASKGLTDVSDIHLDGEDSESVPIYLTAGDIRRSIATALKLPGVSQASFARHISSAANMSVSAQNLKTFTSKKGIVGGADSPAFYAAYVYFEKERVKKGDKKSKHREEMEEMHGKEGMSRHGDKPLWMGPGEKSWYDKYGRLLINGEVCK